MKIKGFFKITGLKIILTAILFIVLTLIVRQNQEKTSSLSGVTYENYMSTVYSQCCGNKNLSQTDIEYCKKNSLSNQSECEAVKQSLEYLHKENEKNNVKQNLFLLIISMALSYLGACVVNFAYEILKK